MINVYSKIVRTVMNKRLDRYLHFALTKLGYRTLFLKRPSFLNCTSRSRIQNFTLFEGLRSFRGSHKSEKFNFSKRQNESVDHEFKYFT